MGVLREGPHNHIASYIIVLLVVFHLLCAVWQQP